MMDHRRINRNLRIRALLTTAGPALLPAVAITLAGCGGSSGRGGTTAVKPADFVTPQTDSAAPLQTAAARPSDRPSDRQPTRQVDRQVDRTGPVAASDGIFDVTAQVGRPEMSASDAGPVEQPRLVQAKVGDINGRAVYAMDFLGPMGNRFTAEAKKLKPAAWMEFAEKEIRRELETQIENELLMAEARESLTPEQQQGFFAFLQDVRANLYSENRGSRAAANKKLFESEGVNEEQWLRTREEEALIRHQLNEQINSKTVVSWREIRQSYERNYDKWNPPPRAFFHIIRVSKNKPDTVEAVGSSLAGGADFLSLAASQDNEWKRADAGIEIRPIKGEFAEGDFFSIDKLNDAARNLKAGQWAGPIDWGSTSAWVYLEKVENESLSLFQAQLIIERAIREGKSDYKRKKYVQRMKAEASITDVDEMTNRLLAIAAERYLPGGVPPPSPASTPASSGQPGPLAPAGTPIPSLK